jgi:putative lipoprotein (rSAM/lipoprotein system)
MKKILLIKRRILKNALLILGVCGAGLMTSCAKYGVLVSTFYMKVKGTVRSKESLKEINGIQVEVLNNLQYSKVLTDSTGAFSINAEIDELERSVDLHVSDIDGALNGSFLSKDTVITLTSDEKLAQLKDNIDIKLVQNE